MSTQYRTIVADLLNAHDDGKYCEHCCAKREWKNGVRENCSCRWDYAGDGSLGTVTIPGLRAPGESEAA